MTRLSASGHPLLEEPVDDAQLRAYLLGQLSPADAARLEEQALDDDQTFTALRSVEDDLFDEYVRGRLTPLERERFAERYGARRDRLTFARALAQRNPRRVVSFTRNRWLVGLAAAAVLVLAIGVTVVRRDEVAATPPAATAVRQPEARVADVGTMVALTLATERAAGRPVAVTLPESSPTLELRVRLNPADRFDRYVVELRSSSDNIVWGNKEIRASSEGGELTVIAVVPAPLLAAGAYELAVRGATAAGAVEDLGFMSLEVRRTP